MQDVKLLDCSLRDGGYRTNWHFSGDRVQSVLDLNKLLGIKLVEFGFRFPSRDVRYGPFSFVSDRLLSQFDTEGLDLGFMVEAKAAQAFHSEATFISSTFDACKDFRFLRVAATVEDAQVVNKVLEAALDRGMQLHVNLMRASELEEQDLDKFFGKISAGAESFYLADSFGSLRPETTHYLIELLSRYAPKQIGFHAHNNRSMALANVRSAIQAGATLIDGTWAGHGRGSGNARLEELTTEISDGQLSGEAVFEIGTHLETHEYEPGRIRDESSFAYHFGAAKGVHPNIVSDLLREQRGLSLGEVVQILGLGEAEPLEDSNADQFLRASAAAPRSNESEIAPGLKGQHCLLIGNSPEISQTLMEVDIAKGLRGVKICTLNGLAGGMQSSPDFVLFLHAFRWRQVLQESAEKSTAIISPTPPPISSSKEFYVVPAKQGKRFETGDGHLQIPQMTALAYALGVLAHSGATAITLAGFGGGLEETKKSEEKEILESFREQFPSISLSELGQRNYGLPLAEIW